MKRQTRTKRRILISAFLVIALLAAPFHASACPHFDDEEDLYWAFYNEDYTIMTQVFPRQWPLHLLSRTVPVDEPWTILTELFSFPLVQSRESYMSVYALVDDFIATDGWGQGLDEFEFQTTVEGSDDAFVFGTGVNLMVGFANTFEASRQHVNDDVYEMHYDIRLTKLNDEVGMPFPEIAERLDRANLELATPEIVQISTNFTTMSDSWELEQIEISALYDPVEVQIETWNSENENDVVAINLSRPFHASEAIPVSFRFNEWQWIGTYSFEIEEPGIFALVNADFDTELFNYIFAAEEDEGEETSETDGFNILWIVMPLVLITGAGIAVVFVLGMKKKKERERQEEIKRQQKAKGKKSTKGKKNAKKK
ncbi:MAG: hypothetical protein FWE08_07690 [Oscillospiraceae bacterium]|nr:hypothetical protein [Oscillospiraceae bacterium]